ncbi:pyridoxamine 5'-phosphate oxidase family protein [Nostoc sp. UHCC 0302]|uniref:pyridoxamine 5'-phosphate oxidase family protein n=1 Tax=Nostoc sp. UHCC 0302 TaxID=3134896 RepID=UPI00311CBA23
MVFHTGEIAVQTQVGVKEEAQSLSSVISNIIKPSAEEFLSNQQFAIASTIDANGNIWASLLTGHRGFIRVLNEQSVQIETTLIATDPLNQNLQHHDYIGLLIIDLAQRKRLRLNGRALNKPPEKIKIQIQQTFFNCPKYIQVRHLETVTSEFPRQVQIQTTNALNLTQQYWIAQSDTFFIASSHPERGADASHRGGFPGFVQILDSQKLVFPDYAGNNMFQTLGNLVVNPNAGLLFIDFAAGHTLQITGKAKVIWETKRLAAFPGAQRLVEFDISQVWETRNASSLRWRFEEYSPANPG